MAAVMQILGWKSSGLRCPDHELDCCEQDGNPSAVTLVQMPNGTGKTTTLELLRATLSGAARDNAWPRERVMEFRKVHDPQPEGAFELRLMLDDHRVTIALEFDFFAARAHYRTTRGDGQVHGFDPPTNFRRLMDPSFVRFYVFDGELADNILDRNQTDAQTAVESLFQVHLLTSIESKISSYWDEKTRTVTARDRAGFTRRTNNLQKWKSRLAELKHRRANLQQHLDSVADNLQRQQERYDSEIGKEEHRQARVQSAQAALAKLESRLVHETQGVLDFMRDPYRVSEQFAHALYELKGGLDRVKLPESAAREFFEELADEEHCVCGRPIDGHTRDAIRARATQYLGTDDVSLLNNLKAAIEDCVGASQTQPSASLSSELKELAASARSRMSAQNDLDELRHEAEQSDPAVGKAKDEIDRLNYAAESLKVELSRLDEKGDLGGLERIGTLDPVTISSIEKIAEGVSVLEQHVAEITRTLVLRQKRDVLQRIVSSAHARARRHILAAITSDVNERIAGLMPENAIRVREIDRSVVLEHQSTGSAGENLAVCYAFLATLFHRGVEHQLPFIVDSPANSIDNHIRPRIGELVPRLTGQFIAFVISSERPHFVPVIKRAVEGSVKYVTLFRKGRNTPDALSGVSGSCFETSDGIQVVDEEFFSKFQIAQEEA